MSSSSSIQTESNAENACIPKINWPMNGSTSRFLILNVPTITEYMVNKLLAFICSNYYYVVRDGVQRFISVPGIKQHERSNKPMQLEHFFLEPLDPLAEHARTHIDYYRFQSGMEHSKILSEHPTVKNIVRLVENFVNQQLLVKDNVNCSSSWYCVTKVGVLYSRPGGRPQMLHFDDMREKQVIEEEGESLSVIVALQDGTLLDFAKGDGKRATYSIPSTSIFLFSGTCYHGGSTYNRHNVRLHMYLFPKRSSLSSETIKNIIIVRKPCPVKGCKHAKKGETFTEKQLYYHWGKHHLKHFGLSVGKYVKQLDGEEVLQCTHCRKGFNNARCLTRHKHKCLGSALKVKKCDHKH